MSDPVHLPGVPSKVLLATDLSARGDRALERALHIVRRYAAQLVIVHAFEEMPDPAAGDNRGSEPSWRRPPDAAEVTRRRLTQGLRDELGAQIADATVVVEEGVPADIIERVAVAERVDLVVTGIAREGLFASRPVVLGRTVEQLLRRLPLPILIVRNRVQSDYRHVVVATDFSPASGFALQVASRFFPAQPLHLLHASEAPYATLAPDAERHAASFLELHAADLAKFLDDTFLPAADRQRLVPRIEPGAPQALVREYVNVQGADLVVLGTRGRGAVLEALLGSTAKNILATLPCDALVVRAPPP